jgi:alpha-aminoadipic semialdehyde synthase
MTIGIRREDKNIWEKRTPLIPDHISMLHEKYGLKTIVQPSPIRIYEEEDYAEAGAEISEDLSNADVVFAVKEIPAHLIDENKTYIFFSHTIKGQPYNMKMLKTLMEKNCNLIDYERIVDEKEKRLIFFGRYAGKAGMVETLHALGRKLKLKKINNPFEKIKQAYQYESIEATKHHFKKIGSEISKKGFSEEITPLVIGFSGYGNVSQGAQEMFDILPFLEVTPEQLVSDYKFLKNERHKMIKVVFKEENTVKPKKGRFDLHDYFVNPENYESQFDQYIPLISVLVNCVLWTEKNPRLITKDYLKKNPDGKLIVIGDISCDIEGSVEITYEPTNPASPCYTYFPKEDKYEEDLSAEGISIMAIDNLPCEYPRDASAEFSNFLKNYVKEIYYCDFDKTFEELELSYPIKRGLILHKGNLTNEYLYMNNYLERSHQHE